MMKGSLYIDGKWIDAAGGRSFPTLNPATGEVLGYAADGGKDETRLAIEAAHRAFPKWSRLSALERADYLMACYDAMMSESERLAEIMTLEQGKPLQESRNEVLYAASFFRWFGEEARRVYGETIPASAADKRIIVIQQPVGVVAAITPWNFPQGMPARKIAPALAAGCTVILKPAKQTPLNATVLFEVLEKAGLPKGVINLVTTARSGEVGEEILRNEKVRKITFTGSTDIGKYLTREAAGQMKRVSMELGGHAPFIVFADANLEEAVNGVMASKYRNAGQTCVCANRVYVERPIKEKFEALFKAKVESLRMGDGLDSSVNIGPLIDENAVAKSEEHVKDAVAKGARILVGGSRGDSAGHFYEPTILTDVTDDMQICSEETFGPVAPVMVFDTVDEVIERANNVPYGLASYFYTNDIHRAVYVAERLEYGIVGLNDALPAVAQAPFGGVKESGVGREGGREGLKDFLETKYISMKVL